MTNKCANCRWWFWEPRVGVFRDRTGDCAVLRAAGPKTRVKARIHGAPGGWLNTDHDFGCSEFMAKDQTDDK